MRDELLSPEPTPDDLETAPLVTDPLGEEIPSLVPSTSTTTPRYGEIEYRVDGSQLVMVQSLPTLGKVTFVYDRA